MKTDKKPRDQRLDALRGCFLIIMAAVHVPTPVSNVLKDPLGWFGAAEGFVFLGACLAGWIYGRSYLQVGWRAMAQRVWGRARLIYCLNMVVLVPTTLAAWILAPIIPTLANHFADFLVHPWGSLALMPLLLHQPPLFDILPLYIIFLGLTPWVLAFARRHGWGGVLTVSALGWLAAQFKLDARLIGDPARLLPLRWGAFDPLAWQFLWFSGIALGAALLQRPTIRPAWRWAAGLPALAVILFGFLARHGPWPPGWGSDSLAARSDKWTLGPLRLANFGAWVILLLIWNPRLPRWLLAPTALLGRHSLAVYAFHLPLVIAATVVIQTFALADSTQTWAGLLVITLLFPWAACLEWRGHRTHRKAITQSDPHTHPAVASTSSAAH